MRLQVVKALVVIAAGLSLAGCNITSDAGSMFLPKSDHADARTTLPPPASIETTGSIAPRPNAGVPAAAGPAPQASAAATVPVLPGADGKDDVSRGRAQFRAGNYAEAESAFDRAAKMNPRDAEAWLGLAACYDRMRRFELADRAYVQAMSIKGPTSEILNNQGYSYLLRDDLARARTTLTAAKNKDPGNVYVQNNLQLLASKERSAKAR
ncbi:MAG: tetratricopeptide repeat protein [Pseudolabrys sp.]|nr:tetratricopeptide repeat protein [Pseudolabrys sp.]MDP2293934.1 tetratricopeptide repeat protein [Pseudolabrys sp.]